MDNYSIDLFARLDDFRFFYDNDNIYCHYLLLLFVNEIFVENEKSDENYLSLQENLKITIDAILNFNNFNLDAPFDETKINYDNFDMTNIKDLLKLLNDINSVLNKQENYFLRHPIIISQLNKILEYFNTLEIDSKTFPKSNNVHDSHNDKMIEIVKECKQDYLNEGQEKNQDIDFIASFLSELENNEVIIEEDKEEHKTLNLINAMKEHIYKTESIETLKNNNEEIKIYDNIIVVPENKYKCSKCGISTWNNKPITLLVKYRDNNKDNINLENLYFVCPNCNLS